MVTGQSAGEGLVGAPGGLRRRLASGKYLAPRLLEDASERRFLPSQVGYDGDADGDARCATAAAGDHGYARSSFFSPCNFVYL